MKKPSEMTAGLIAAVMAVSALCWISDAHAGDTAATEQTQSKQRKPTAADVSTGRAAEPSKPIDENVSDTASEVDFDFREGYGGSGEAGKDDGRTDMTDVGRNTKNAEDAVKELGRELKEGAKDADKGVRKGYHDEAADDAPRMTQDKRNDGSSKKDPDAPTMSKGKKKGDEPVAKEDDRTDMKDIGYEVGQSARRLEEAANEAVRKLRGEADEAEEAFEEGYGGSGKEGNGADGGTMDSGKDKQGDKASGKGSTDEGKVKVKVNTK